MYRDVLYIKCPEPETSRNRSGLIFRQKAKCEAHLHDFSRKCNPNLPKIRWYKEVRFSWVCQFATFQVEVGRQFFSVSTGENALKPFFLRWRAYFQAQLPLGAQFAVQEPIARGWLEQLSCATRDHVDHVLTVIIGRLSAAKLMQSKTSKTTVAFLQLKRNVHWKLAVTFHAVVPLVESIPKGELITKPVPGKGLNRWKYQWLRGRWTMGWLIDSSLRTRPVGLRFLKRWAAGWYTLALTLVVIAEIETSVDVFGIFPVLLWFEVLAGHTSGDLETLSTNKGGATASLDCNRLIDVSITLFGTAPFGSFPARCHASQLEKAIT